MVHYIIEIPDDWGKYEREILREEIEMIIQSIEKLRGLREVLA